MSELHPPTFFARRRSTITAALLAAVLLSLGLGAAPAHAATVGSEAALKLALTPGADPVISLTASITVADYQLVIPRTVTLDLAGFDLTTANLVLDPGVTFTITDSSANPADAGTLTATGTAAQAGISSTGATLIIDGGHIVAVGGNFGAGIGSGDSKADGGTVIINGGTVQATGGATGGAGIGSGWGAGPTDITIHAGSVTATGGYNAAGIGNGGGYATSDTGDITIEGGTVVATGGEQGGSGIGSGVCGDGGLITISGGDVTAQGLTNGMGIGAYGGCGTSGAPGVTILITGGTVSATGGYFGIGIGAGIGAKAPAITIDGGVVEATGGDYAPGMGAFVTSGPVSIGAGGTATVTGGATASAFGPGSGALTALNVAGELILPAGSTLRLASTYTATVASTGRISGAGSIVGDGTIDNHGRITLPDANVTLPSITDHHYLVSFDPQLPGGPLYGTARVFATTFTDGARIFPPDPVLTGRTFLGWNTSADGTGTAFTPTSVLTGAATGAGLASTVYAQWTGYLVVSPADPSAVAGDTIAFTVEAFDGAGNSAGDVTAQATLASSNGVLDPVTGSSITFTVAAASPGAVTTVTATLAGNPALTGTTTVAVEAAEAVSMTLTPSDSSVDQGDTITVVISGVDQYGNQVHDLAAKSDLTSDHPFDVISGLSVRFPEASTHVLTATLRSNPAVFASAAVAVRPAAGPIAAVMALTGTDPTGALLLALVLVLAGIAVSAASVRRRRA